MNIFPGILKTFIIWAVSVCWLSVWMPSAFAVNDDLTKLTQDDFQRLRANSWRVVGNNVILDGDVYMPVGNTEVFADRVIVNLDNRDFEAIGNVRVYRWTEVSGPATLERIAELEKSANTLVKSVAVSRDMLGNRSYSVKAVHRSDTITADRVCGNWDSAYFKFSNVSFTYNTFVCRAESAEHLPSGETILENGEVSACNYLESNNAHYSVAASKIRVIPHVQRFYGIEHVDFDKGDRTILLTNGFAKIYGVPVLWLPFFWKPKDEDIGLCNLTWGSSDDWGYYLRLSKRFRFGDYPALQLKLMTDLFKERGVGYGVSGRVATEESRTDFFAYAIYDQNRYETDDYYKYRIKIPKYRYNMRLSNVTHITPRLDFRGVVDYSSDPYFKRDFFSSVYEDDPQPATFGALEQQFDRFSAALYMRFRLNDFYTTVERIPEIRVDLPRQEIFNTGLYYQGDAVATNFRMKWTEFDSAVSGYSELKDYEAFRFDTTHFLYYPIRNRYFTFVPRGGVKLTVYSESSKRDVSEDDIVSMIAASRPQSSGKYHFNNYDDDGGSKVRFAAEAGFELSTKIHNTWQHIRSPFFQLDGLRHIMQPYINYTFISKPTVDRENIYFFDEIDRLDEQNFVRFGLVNRFQTRNGSGIGEVFFMENFWDLHLQRQDGMSHVGNLGTLLRWKIFKGLSLHTQFLMDISGDGEVADTYRNGRNAGKTGLALKWLNQWNIGIDYVPAPDWKFTFTYNYLRPYSIRSAYSMGSTLTQINATSYFLRKYDERNETFTFGLDFPVTPDRRTLGFFRFAYEVEQGSIDVVKLTLLHKFHCWELIGSIEMERDYDARDWDFNYSIQANLTGLNPRLNNVQNRVLRGLENAAMSGFTF